MIETNYLCNVVTDNNEVIVRASAALVLIRPRPQPPPQRGDSARTPAASRSVFYRKFSAGTINLSASSHS